MNVFRLVTDFTGNQSYNYRSLCVKKENIYIFHWGLSFARSKYDKVFVSFYGEFFKMVENITQHTIWIPILVQKKPSENSFDLNEKFSRQHLYMYMY